MIRQLLLELERKSGHKLDVIETSNHSFILALTDDLVIELQPRSPGLYLQGIIGNHPLQDKEDLYMKLLQANFLQKGMGQSIIGISSDEKTLTLSADFPYELDYITFKDNLELFANGLSFWKEELKRWQELKIPARHKE